MLVGLNLTARFVGPCRGKLSSSVWSHPRGLLVNMPMLVKSSFSKQHSILSMQTVSTTTQLPLIPGQPSKVFVKHNFFKGKAALRMEPIAPVFSPVDKSGAVTLSKMGSVLLSFAPAIAPKQYDWNKKQMFALSSAELGSFLSLGPNESLEFFHDPFMGKRTEGQVRKVLHVVSKPNNEGYFFKLNISNKLQNIDGSMVIPITNAEFAVMKATFNFILPYIMGWYTFANFIKPGQATHISSGNLKLEADSNRELD